MGTEWDLSVYRLCGFLASAGLGFGTPPPLQTHWASALCQLVELDTLEVPLSAYVWGVPELRFVRWFSVVNWGCVFGWW